MPSPENNFLSCISDITSNYIISDLSKLSLNEKVIHFEYGIGKYQGLTVIENHGIPIEYIVLIYANNDKLYVPIYYLHLISGYSGTFTKDVPLHKLGQDTWIKERKKITKKIYDLAIILLDIYANKKLKYGFAFQKKEQQYKSFCNDFKFELTKDQLYVMNEVLSDMYKPKPMNRLICGDVGFGKTEIAMRASFLTIVNNKQVALLVPTTLLAQQHFNSFKDRFSNWPVTIRMLSRFCTEKQTNEIFQLTQTGNIDILVGTHKLLSKYVSWHDLGLLIIDEEHRFGVYHKEKIKSQFNNIDILILTATPIPRTLNMAMTGMRDLSIISTPPTKRLSVETNIREYSTELIKRIILKEIIRKGQIYYIYNNIKNIEKKAKFIAHLIPEAKIAIAHGRMSDNDLKKIMYNFYRHKFDILICTTIIETGINIPKVNSIIIEKADHFGITQLHQLRGRVGRSHYQAYAWLLVSNFKTLSINAKKRLESVSLHSDFGSGLILSLKDLEIRGIGELLGHNQSGHIKQIGLSLYSNLLRTAIKNLQIGNRCSVETTLMYQPKIEIQIPAMLPSYYINDVNVRLSLYKKIVHMESISQVHTIKHELIKKFGELPEVANNLLHIIKLRILAKEIQIKRIECDNLGGEIEFLQTSHINTTWIAKQCMNQPNNWKIKNHICLQFIKQFKGNKYRIKWIRNLLLQIKKK